ncbi:odorant receptor 43a-like [Schistocerca cancellata]|uniref:odorant receptor 43a-like n=1 Tax=Schistocerca cancellata TaxID=274614 RepID=UPI00211849A1|nr:odorant receptor 43a-like [Schistocerca cancellata]
MSWHSQQEQPLTWQYTAASILKFDVRILHAIGVWALPVTRVYRAYTGIILVLVVAYSVEAVIHIGLVRFNLDDVTLAVSTYAVIVSSTGKLLFFLHHEPGYWRLVRWLDALVADQKQICEERPPLQAIFDRAQKRATRFTHALRIYNTSLILAWVFTPLMAPPGQRPLPFHQLPLSETDDFPLYIASYLLQSVCMLYMSLVSGSMDGFFTAVMIHTAAQFRILAWRIAELRQNNEGRKQQARSDVYEKSRKAAETDDVYEELRLCIRTHQEITSFAAHLESVMKSIAALQLVTGVMNGCLMIFPTAASSESGASLLKCVACVPTISAQVLIYCLGAHSVQEQSEAVSQAAYDCGWPDTSPRCRHALLVVMARAMKRVTLTAGGIYAIERSTFLSLLNAGYSYYALLKNFNSR